MSSTNIGRVVLLAVLMGPAARAQLRSVEIRAETRTENVITYKRVGKVKRIAQSQYTRRLEVTVRNLGSKKLEQVVVKYYLFVRDVAMDVVEVAGMGQTTLAVPPMREVSFVTEPVEVTHRVEDDAGGRFVGQVVQVWQGQTVLGELREPKDMHAQFAKAIPQAAATVSRWQAIEKKLHRGKKKAKD